MELIEIVRKDGDLVNKIMNFCDFEIYQKEQTPSNNNGKIHLNINGMALGCDGSGGEYILLEDDTIGFRGSENECGRIAENIIELFELLINCPYWKDCLYIDLYKNDIVMKKCIMKIENDYTGEYNDYDENNYKKIQDELSKKLSIKIYENKMVLLKRFYKTTNRNPRYNYIYMKNNGEKIISDGDGTLIIRPSNNHIKNSLEK
jgi:hypothetical protein